MYAQFFLARDSWCFAWGALLLITIMSLATQILAVLIVKWNGRFFNGVQELLEQGHVSGAEVRHELLALVYDYVFLLGPSVVLTPINRRLVREYTLRWRLTLMDSYAARWGSGASLEGAAQRVQEDTKKLGDGLVLVFSEVVTAVFALVAFTPLLLELSRKTALAYLPPSFGEAWLLWLAIGLASLGLLVTAAVARKLVEIDMRNQVVEAALRKRLVFGEQDAGADESAESGAHNVPETPATPAVQRLESFSVKPLAQTVEASEVFVMTADLLADARTLAGRLRANYISMFNNFVVIDIWNTFYIRGMVVLPYLLTTPSLFAAEGDHHITLGDMQMLRYVFFDVFFALNAFAQHWPEINELRATIRRLREYEERLQEHAPDTKKQKPRVEKVHDILL